MDPRNQQNSRKREFQDKEAFVSWLRNRTKTFAIDTIKFCDLLPKKQATQVIGYQLIKSATSTAANYRAACRARSGAEFFSKMCIVVEEGDESIFWYEVIKESELQVDQNELNRLIKEADEIVALMATAKKNTHFKQQ